MSADTSSDNRRLLQNRRVELEGVIDELAPGHEKKSVQEQGSRIAGSKSESERRVRKEIRNRRGRRRTESVASGHQNGANSVV